MSKRPMMWCAQDGLEAIVGADDAAWLAAEARKAK